MVENKNSSNNGHSPFRRYVPPTSNGNDPSHGQVMPFPQTPNYSTQDRRQPPSAAARNRRSARSRWRQWVNTSLAGSKAGVPQSPVQPPQQQQSPFPKADKPSTPSGKQVSKPQISQPSSPLSRPSAFIQTPSGTPPQGQPSRPINLPHARQPASTGAFPPRPAQVNPPNYPPGNKVTPLRRKPVWSSPAENEGKSAPLRDRRPSRRSSRQRPRPVLYGLRLLILGTGVAAITGTILSTIKPGNQTANSGPLTTGVAEVNQSQAGRRNQSSVALSNSLPLNEELAYLETELVSLEAMTPGLSQSIFFYDLDTGNYVDLNGTSAVSAASTIKVPILVAFLEAVDAGNLRLDQALTLQEDLIGGGSGEMQTHEIGSQYTALEVATEMIINSDNTATNMMIALLGGQASLNQRFQAWGLSATVFRNALPDLEGTNTTSSADLVRLMALVDQGEILNMRSRDRMLSIMQRTYNRTLIPDGLGDEGAITFNKTGDIGGVLGDIALIDAPNGKRYALGVLVTRPHNDGRANELIRRVAGRIHAEMNQPISPVGGSIPSVTPSDVLETAPVSPPAPDSDTNLDVPRG
ncbi:MAG: serine hydrolase [Leptolyngbya sp. SIO1D8]|nr:serine hydrolase [Leptolyngbya sp. SIO1D8]